MNLGMFSQLWREQTADQRAKICAYVLAPSVVFGFAVSGMTGHSALVDLTGPISVTELRTQTDGAGHTEARSGVAVFLDSGTGEATLRIGGQSGRLWSSLDGPAIRANKSRLMLTGDRLLTRTPLLGVAGSSIVVVEGTLGDKIDVPGGTVSVDDFRLASKGTTSVLLSALLACVFALGMALAASGPGAPDQYDGGEITT